MKTVKAYRGMVTSPHYLASQSGLAVLREGGNAVEAALAVASSLCVVYPHMAGMGGDTFWTIYDPASGRVVCIDGSGHSGKAAGPEFLRANNLSALPQRGPLSIVTCAGAVSGWQAALEEARDWSRGLPLARIFEDAIFYAEHGYPISSSQCELLQAKLEELKAQPGFAAQFLPGGKVPLPGSRQSLPALGRTLRRLASEGLDSFYRGPLAREIAGELRQAGSIITLEDLEAQRALRRQPLELDLSGRGKLPSGGLRLYNCPPPTQGVASLLILGLFARLLEGRNPDEFTDFELVHGLVECTKRAFKLRDEHLADYSDELTGKIREWFKPEYLDKLASGIDMAQASPWPAKTGAGDTVWFGVIDAAGRAVSCILSIYFEFGSGVTLPETGLVWHNRGLGFCLKDGHANCIGPRKRPFHTLNPALACFDDGRTMPYGTMGGEGQPQTQAALFSRYAWLGWDLQKAISAPRWLLGRTWGEDSTSLKLEADFKPELIEDLKKAGHPVEVVAAQNTA
ncbi:gamma-glutamyltransferase family protein, partial [Desulfovibrio sp. OttesenSCG-928-C14]|nr:gamma-glutamyltransferase family protein [Desulfovibrio sp. OttesenSCG-928-C14]